MSRGGWKQRLADDVIAYVEGVEEVETGYRYEVRLSIEAATTVNIIPTGEVNISGTERVAGANEGVRVSVTIPSVETVERVLFRIEETTGVVYLPSPQFLDACRALKAGDEAAARRVIDTFDSPIQLAIICGSFLSLDELLKLLAGVAAISRHASSLLHSYRYGTLRAALTSHSGLTVESINELEELVAGLDAISEIGPVNLLDAIGDVMATLHEKPAETDELLDSLGVDRHALERRHDGYFFLCSLAQLMEADGIEAAEGYAMSRRWWHQGNYDGRVLDAKHADFGERGAAWRRLLCAAARKGQGEFAYVVANACYWSVKERQADARVSELLLSGAIQGARKIDLVHLEERARFERRLDVAHRLRSSHIFELALVHFHGAERLAQDYAFLPTWRARYGRGICEAHAKFDDDDADSAIASLETTMDALFEIDIDDDNLTTAVHHLTAQKYEVLGDSTPPGVEARDHYSTACDHFEIIGFDRSRDRCARKRAQIETTDDPSATSEAVQDSEREATSLESDELVETATSVAEPPPEKQAAETELYPAVTDHERRIEAEREELGSPDLGIPPSEDDHEEFDDPYIF